MVNSICHLLFTGEGIKLAEVQTVFMWLLCNLKGRMNHRGNRNTAHFLQYILNSELEESVKNRHDFFR